MVKWFDITMAVIIAILGVATIWKRDIPFEIEGGPELFRIKGVNAVFLGIVEIAVGVYFLLKAVQGPVHP